MLVTQWPAALYRPGFTASPADLAINLRVCDAFKNIANGTVAAYLYVLFIFIAGGGCVFIMSRTAFATISRFKCPGSHVSGINTGKSRDYDLYVLRILGGISGYPGLLPTNSAKSSNGSTYTLLLADSVVLGGVHPDGARRVAGGTGESCCCR